VRWSNQAAFNIGDLSASGRMWVTRQAGEEDIEDCLVPLFGKLETIIVWAWFKEKQKGALIFWNKNEWGKTINAVFFSTYIVPQFFQFWEQQFKEHLDYIYLQQVGAAPYSAKHTQNHHWALGIWGYFIDWPPSSRTAALLRTFGGL